ncbi:MULTISPECIES: hypothetical protein [unclassified Alcanivorax]|uniref:hypothetical protein n=1 Tax=unclassified Alcanivorax TaxID=2638842 RepID=UPI000AAE0A01|nr:MULTISPECIES: hypothetical protein [unclassified Alcanivorax]
MRDTIEDRHDHNNSLNRREETPRSPLRRVLEKEKLMLLALMMLVAGALMLGFFAHSEGIEARSALKNIQLTLTQAADSL